MASSRPNPLPPIPSVRFPSPDTTDRLNDRSDVAIKLPTPVDRGSAGNFSDTHALIDTADESFSKYQSGRGVKVLNKAGDSLSAIQTDVTKVQSYASPLQGLLDTEPVKAIRKGITALVDGLPALLRVLDDVAQIHPFIKIAVGAFRVAIELDFKRKDNDKKISLLFIEMRDMMSVLVQLQDIDKGKRAGVGGETVETRMQHLCKKAEEDIRKCANACNAYAKKRTFCKILQGSSWEDTFQGYVKCFTTRRGEFELALSLFIGRAVNAANDMLVGLETKMDRLLQYFEACASPEEREIVRFVKQNGGPDAVMRDEKLLRELYDSRAGASVGMPRSTDRRAGRHEPVDDFTALQLELKVDVQTAIRDNLEQFEQKFAIQQRELAEELRRAVRRDGDRIIESVTSGPHDRIIDPDIHEIWKEMRWRGNVKARHFVLALRDYFREKLDHLKRAKKGATPIVAPHQLSEQDEWTLEYINVTRLQPIIEAFDDDASGFITVTEVNAFTTARPDSWSLLHWLAYWAIGYQMVMSNYAEKIDVLLAKMFSIKSQVLPANRTSVEQYLDIVWTGVTEFTSAFRRINMDDTLYGRFESYIKSEEDRLRKNLETVKYDIDAPDTLELVQGPGRVEKYLLPVLYLLLKRDFEIMRLARSRLLHVDELFDATDTVTWVFDVVRARHEDLSDLFKQQRLDPDQQFKIFGFEILRYWHDDSELWSMKNVREARFIEHAYDDGEEAQDVVAASVINHPLQAPEELFTRNAFVATEDDKQADAHIKAIIGHWSCFCAIGSRYPSQSMIDLDIHASSDPKEFQSSGIAANGTNWKVTGGYTADDDGVAHYKFTLTYTARFSNQYFRGELAANGTTFSGTWAFWDAFTEGVAVNTFVCKRLPPSLMRLWPSPAELVENKARALWRFAIDVTVAEVRKRLHSWQWLRQRWETGQRYIELIVRREIASLTDEETMELARCQRRMTPDEARLYQMFRDLRQRSIPVHFEVYCDACGSNIRGARIMCLSCGMKSTIDLCDQPGCHSREVNPETRDDLLSPHLPTHDVFKVRTAIHQIREFGPAHRAAQKALSTARQALAAAADPGETAIQKKEQLGAAEDKGEAALTTTPVVNAQLRCAKCSERVSEPCWYCIECEDDFFLCIACDEKHGGIASGKHKATHGLVRCQPPDASTDADSERAQLDARIGTLEHSLREMQYKLEQSLGGVDDKINVVQARLSGKMGQVDDRLARIENMLLVIGRSFEGERAALPRRTPGRYATLPGGTGAGSLGGEADSVSESDFSAWVRELRRSP